MYIHFPATEIVALFARRVAAHPDMSVPPYSGG